MTPERELHWRTIAYYAYRCQDWASHDAAVALLIASAIGGQPSWPPADDDEGSA